MINPPDHPESWPLPLHGQWSIADIKAHLPDKPLFWADHAIAHLLSALQRAEEMRDRHFENAKIIEAQRRKAEARIAELEREVEAMLNNRNHYCEQMQSAEARVKELERDIDGTNGWRDSCAFFEKRAEAAERERDEWKAKHEYPPFKALTEKLAQAEKERDSYMHAKAENDERFMLERDTLRAENDRLRPVVEKLAGEDGFPFGYLELLAREALK